MMIKKSRKLFDMFRSDTNEWNDFYSILLFNLLSFLKLDSSFFQSSLIISLFNVSFLIIEINYLSIYLNRNI